jgi:hypothetical protein
VVHAQLELLWPEADVQLRVSMLPMCVMAATAIKSSTRLLTEAVSTHACTHSHPSARLLKQAGPAAGRHYQIVSARLQLLSKQLANALHAAAVYSFLCSGPCRRQETRGFAAAWQTPVCWGCWLAWFLSWPSPYRLYQQVFASMPCGLTRG